MIEIIPNGVVEDPRSEELKAQDYKHADVFGTEIVWAKKKIEDLKKYTSRNQDGSLSCCMQGSAKGVETLIGTAMSAINYFYRTNYPEGGMWIQDIGNIWKKYGSCLESEMKSQKMTESEMNSAKINIPLNYKNKGYIQPNPKSIDEIAQAIETWGHCMLIFHANHSEWTGKPVYNGKEIDFGHCICGIDKFLYDSEEKCIWIEDSAGLTSTLDGQHRIITEDYLKARCSGAIYFTGVNPLELPYLFTKVLRKGSRGYDVKKLQEKLGGLKVDGIFGNDTKSSVIGFQLTHHLVADGIVGKNTNAELNKL